MDKNDIKSVLDKVIAWRDASANHTVFCLFGDRNCKKSYTYNSSVGGSTVILSHMIYTEMKRDNDIAEAIAKAFKIYRSEL